MKTKTTVLSKFMPNDVSNNSANLEDQLTAFVQKSLADSYSQDVDATLQQLDAAWEAQKLVWQMRDDTKV
ncbi:MAG: hypothetical protein JGK24_14245 [Microcoleus sp. PH2017_29_MFU_D_A]|uniref:hypothetical protein n=2 Tax=unclassified Microcoleus TaxID=2642155 RepID=UPI001DA8E470|nr:MULTISPECIES: hypothetical protein [unclassified Microcoleus]MCC3419605.1 hypothetical protein [Microcoleus sp. PH2017_07_MST_O_A]MCC3430937.1 hypothetical protein [Microcoleus sp. PH2017_04_SCI_O_A]MCC3443889.1 hypothetical protein [Microcoleus sp. PH2017_03_ELD_O_A]MCC3466112.1 hypothetical protein [Microcoleus sp. PH2017_06_SFM_O_A]MCC3505160.1 hypothetical protein [Microcoleus sp. PH2017_19_SFW_U_A]MCC3511859.1 hypothetical protein [Microcoleus sp. PH2017_17_BER_D_A]MCC3567612.1 hypot